MLQVDNLDPHKKSIQTLLAISNNLSVNVVLSEVIYADWQALLDV